MLFCFCTLLWSKTKCHPDVDPEIIWWGDHSKKYNSWDHAQIFLSYIVFSAVLPSVLYDSQTTMRHPWTCNLSPPWNYVVISAIFLGHFSHKFSYFEPLNLWNSNNIIPVLGVMQCGHSCLHCSKWRLMCGHRPHCLLCLGAGISQQYRHLFLFRYACFRLKYSVHISNFCTGVEILSFLLRKVDKALFTRTSQLLLDWWQRS